jgi:hypothetical protein
VALIIAVKIYYAPTELFGLVYYICYDDFAPLGLWLFLNCY